MPNDQTHVFKGVNSLPFEARYDNYIGGEWVAPKSGKYFTNTTPITGAEIGQIARSNAEDIEAALDAKGEAQAANAARQIATRIPGTQITLSKLIDLGPYGAQDHAGTTPGRGVIDTAVFIGGEIA